MVRCQTMMTSTTKNSVLDTPKTFSFPQIPVLGFRSLFAVPIFSFSEGVGPFARSGMEFGNKTSYPFGNSILEVSEASFREGRSSLNETESFEAAQMRQKQKLEQEPSSSQGWWILLLSPETMRIYCSTEQFFWGCPVEELCCGTSSVKSSSPGSFPPNLDHFGGRF